MAAHPVSGEPGGAAVEGHPRGEAPLADALRAGTSTERERLAAFVLEEATAFAANPFPSTTAGAARQRWVLCEIEFEATQVAAAGLPCLMAALTRMPLHQTALADTLSRRASYTLTDPAF